MDLWLACVDQILTVRLFRSDRYSGRVLLPDRSTASKLWNQQRPKQQRILEHVRVAGIVTTAEPVESPGASGSLRTTVPRFARVVIGSRSCSGAAGACFRNRRLICRRCRPSGKDCAPGSPFARPCRMIARTAAASGAASTWPPGTTLMACTPAGSRCNGRSGRPWPQALSCSLLRGLNRASAAALGGDDGHRPRQHLGQRLQLLACLGSGARSQPALISRAQSPGLLLSGSVFLFCFSSAPSRDFLPSIRRC